jgi:hypothetical protein
MNKTKILLYGGAGLGLAAILRYVYKNAQLVGKWDYSVDDFKMVEFTPRLKGNFHFTLINKSAFSAQVKDIDLKVFTDGKQLSSIYQAGPYMIAPDGKTKIYITIDVKPSDVINNWRTIFSQIISTSDIKLDFIGNMKLKTPIGWVRVPIRYSDTGKNLYKLYKEYYT